MTYDAWSLISQAIASATSPGSPARPSGTSGADPVDPAGRRRRRHGSWCATMPGRDADDPDAFAGDLLREAEGQRVDAGLRGGVLDVLPRRARASRRPS